MYRKCNFFLRKLKRISRKHHPKIKLKFKLVSSYSKKRRIKSCSTLFYNYHNKFQGYKFHDSIPNNTNLLQKISSPSFHQPFNQPNSTAESTLSTLLDSERYLRAVHILSLPLPFQIISLYYAFNKRGTARCGRLRVPRASQVFSTFTIRLRRGRSFLEGY